MSEERNRLGFTEKEINKLTKILAEICVGLLVLIIFVYGFEDEINEIFPPNQGKIINENSINELIEFVEECNDKYNGKVSVTFHDKETFDRWICSHE